MSELTKLTIAEARDALAGGELLGAELTEAHIAAVEAARPLNAFMVTETPDRALAMAEASDARRGSGEAGVLERHPAGDQGSLLHRRGLTTAGSHILDGFTPTYESTVSATSGARGR